MSNGKPRIAKDYDKLSEELIARIKMEYPYGFEDHLISYTDAKGQKVSALPFEADEAYYLIRMTRLEAQRIIQEDDDYDDGILREDFGDEIAGADDAADSEEEEEDSYDQPEEEGDEEEDY